MTTETIIATWDRGTSFNEIQILSGEVGLDEITPQYNVFLNGQITGNTGWGFTTNNIRVAQSIQFTEDTDIRGVYGVIGNAYLLPLYEDDTTLELRIETDNGGSPSGNLVNANATKTLGFDDIKSNTAQSYAYGAGTTWIFSTDITLTKDTKYWIVWKPANVNSTLGYYYISYNNAGVYANGNAKYSTTGGASWTNYAAYDVVFSLLNSSPVAGVSSYDSNTSTLTLTNNWLVHVLGIANLTIDPGETIEVNNTSVTGHTLAVGQLTNYYGGGGSITAVGTSDNHISIKGGPTNALYTSYGLLIGEAGSAELAFVDVSGYFVTAALWFNGVYQMIGADSSTFINSYAAYAAYGFTSARRSKFRNCTFTGNHATYCLYIVAGSYHVADFIKCDFNGGTILAYNGDYYYSGAEFDSCTYNGSPLTSNKIANIYPTTTFKLGSVINPTIVDPSGNPIEGAVVSVRCQFRQSDGLYPQYGMSYSVKDASTGGYTTAEEGTSAMQLTDSTGKPQNEHGNATLGVKYIICADTNEHTIFYYGGSKTGVRSMTDYTWNNDGTDYGFLVQVTKDGYQGYQTTVDPSTDYTDTITLYPVSTISNQQLSDYSITTAEYTTASCSVTNSPDIVGVRINGKDFPLTCSGSTCSATIFGKDIGTCSNVSSVFYASKDSVGDTATASSTLTVDLAGTSTVPIEYANICNRTQEIVRAILLDDTDLKPVIQIKVGVGDYVYAVYDGEPTTNVKGLASYIIVNTPELAESRLTMGQTAKMDIDVSVGIEVRGKKEDKVREMADLVRNALFTAQDTTRGYNLKLYGIDRSSLRKTYIGAVGEKDQPEWTVTLSANYKYRGV